MPRKTAPRKITLPEHTSDPTCFVMMPFGGHFDTYYEVVYKPAIEAASLQPRRADNLFRPSAIIEDIWKFTKNASMMLADLTGRNPNVFYELGLAHAIGKPAVLISETIEDVPFDLRSLRVITFDKHLPNWGDELRRKITESIKEALAHPPAAVPSTFLNIDNAKPAPSAEAVSQLEKDILQLRGEFEKYKQTQAQAFRSHLADGAASLFFRQPNGAIGFFGDPEKPSGIFDPNAPFGDKKAADLV